MLQPKVTDRLNGYKTKTQIYAVYKRPTSDLETHTDWKWGDIYYNATLFFTEVEQKNFNLYVNTKDPEWPKTIQRKAMTLEESEAETSDYITKL